MMEIDLSSANLGRVADQEVNGLRIANQDVWLADSGPVTYTIFPGVGGIGTDGPSLDSDDNGTYTLGLQFRALAECLLTETLFWRAPNRSDGFPIPSRPPTRCGLFDIADGLLVQPGEDFTDPGATTGIISHAFSSPIMLEASHIYRLCVYCAPLPDHFYSGIPFYWDIGVGAAGFDVGPIHIDNDADASAVSSGGQGSYADGDSDLNFPIHSFHANNYGIGLKVTV